MSADSVEDLLSQPAHEVKIVGVVHTPDLDRGYRRFTISEGTLNVAITDKRRVDTKLLVYKLKLIPTDTSGHQRLEPLWLRGHKTINYDTCKRSLWKTATRLPFVLFDRPPDTPQGLEPYEGCELVDLGRGAEEREQFLRNETARKAGVVGVGLAGGRLLDVLRLAASMEVVHEPRLLGRAYLALRFQWQFVDALVQARVWGLRRTDRLNPFERNVVSIPPMNEGEPHKDLRRPGRERYLLTRFKPDSKAPKGKRPVVLVPGFSMSTYWFRAEMPPPQRNITQYLLDHGHEVWLLDYRSSDRLNASLDQFTLDDLAEFDFPDAIEQVSNEVKDKVHIIAHCVGSISVLMSLLRFNLAKRGVHSIILSQAVAFIDQPFVNRLKARLHLAEILRLLGLRPILTPDFDLRSSVAVRLLDRLLYFYPSRERCKSGVCRRLLLIYGDANRHDQLDAVTHEMIYDMVDRGNLTTLAQLEKMAVRRQIVDAAGKDVYLDPRNGKNVDVPITLLQGARNNLFRRSGAHKTLAWLHEHGGFSSRAENEKKFRPLEVPDFGHMDVFIGRNSERIVYPRILEALQDMEKLSKNP
jgi:pimeloyl-ACP methyl ester carboxylesterase